MPDFVRISNKGPVATVTLQRPEVHNAFDEDVISQMTEAFRLLARHDACRVVVLAAAGKSFCAGADLHWMRKMIDYSYEENVDDARHLAAMLEAIYDCPKPTIARVHGAALGGGVGLVAACDIAVALDSAAFGLSEVRLGILPAVISPYLLEKIGPGAARRYFLTAERFDAKEARRLGLVSEVVDSVEALDASIQKIAASILANGPEAVSAAKTLIREVTGWDGDRMASITTRRIAERRASAEGQEGMLAFLEKRPPSWTI